MKIKADVEIAIMTKPNLIGIAHANSEFEKRGLEMVITSLTDGKHREDSKHYDGDAFDVRRWNIPPPEFNDTVVSLRKRLGDDYDVVVERTHIHIEYDPK